MPTFWLDCALPVFFKKKNVFKSFKQMFRFLVERGDDYRSNVQPRLNFYQKRSKILPHYIYIANQLTRTYIDNCCFSLKLLPQFSVHMVSK